MSQPSHLARRLVRVKADQMVVRASTSSTDTEEQKMHDHEITGQLATFMFAGTDTTA